MSTLSVLFTLFYAGLKIPSGNLFFISTWLEKRSRYSEFISHVYTVPVNIK